MITQAKVGILRTRHPTNLGILGSFELFSARLATTQPREFKSTAKSTAWLAAMDD